MTSKDKATLENFKSMFPGLYREGMTVTERHGKWLDGQGFAGNYYDCFVCDQCKKESMAKTNYCPHCGATMRGE